MRIEYRRQKAENRIAPFICVFLTAVLGGCSSVLPVSDAPAPEVEAAPAEPIADTRPVNPYLQNRKPVPAAARKLFAKAMAAMEAGQWRRAEGQLLQLTADYPTLSGAHLNLGICYRQLSKTDLAEDYFKQSIKANANNLDAYNWLALVKREQGDFKLAEQLYQKALAAWPDHAATHYNLGILCELYLGDLERARQHYVHYQKLQQEPDRRVAGWLKDLQRRIQALAENGVVK